MACEMVLGFMFTPDLKKVALCLKDKPLWQAGKMNGVGGKLEKNETRARCMEREAFEETGVMIPADKWSSLGVICSQENTEKPNDVDVVWIYAVAAEEVQNVKPQDGEPPVSLCNPRDLPKNILPNLRWMIPGVLDALVSRNLQIQILVYPSA